MSRVSDVSSRWATQIPSTKIFHAKYLLVASTNQDDPHDYKFLIDTIFNLLIEAIL
jgi:hypothetical protein